MGTGYPVIGIRRTVPTRSELHFAIILASTPHWVSRVSSKELRYLVVDVPARPVQARVPSRPCPSEHVPRADTTEIVEDP